MRETLNLSPERLECLPAKNDKYVFVPILRSYASKDLFISKKDMFICKCFSLSSLARDSRSANLGAIGTPNDKLIRGDFIPLVPSDLSGRQNRVRFRPITDQTSRNDNFPPLVAC